MKNLNLIEVFENKPFQDVGTFNSIFKQTPIVGFSFDTPVQIKELNQGDERKILVGDATIFLKIIQSKHKPKEKIKKIPVLKKAFSETSKELPEIFRKLNPTEYMIYNALLILGKINSIEEFSKKINVSRRTISNAVKRLSDMKMISTELASVNGNPSLTIYLTH
jgi:hypothetical protein